MKTFSNKFLITLMLLLIAFTQLNAAVGFGESDEFTVNTLVRYGTEEGDAFPVNTFIGFGWNESETFGVNTGMEIDQPELLISSNDHISFHAQEDGTYQIRARISNHGLPAENVNVRFFADNQRIGETNIEAIGQNGYAETILAWEPENPNYLIRIVADPENRIDEYIEGNNTRSKRFGGGGDGSRPVITAVTARFDGIDDDHQVGYFIETIEAINRFTIQVQDPGGAQNIDHIEYTINDEDIRQIDQPNENGRWEFEYDMGRIDHPGTVLEVTAYNSAGFSSDTYSVEIFTHDLPAWFRSMAYVGDNLLEATRFEFINGYYEASCKLNPEGFGFEFDCVRENEQVPVALIGGSRSEFIPDLWAGFGYSMFDDTKEFRFQGDWDNISLFGKELKDRRGGFHGGFDVHGAMDNDFNIVRAGGGLNAGIGIKFPTFRTSYPFPIGIQATLEITFRVNGDLEGELNFEVADENEFLFIEPTFFEVELSGGATIAGKAEAYLGVAGVAIAATPTLFTHINVAYTTIDGSDIDWAIGLRIPWEVYVYIGFRGREHFKRQLYENELGPWEWPEDQMALGPMRDELNVNWPKVMASPNMIVDSEGNAVLVWIGDVSEEEGFVDPKILFSFYNSEEDEWSDPDLITEIDAGVSDPVVAFNSDGNPVATWTHNAIEIDEDTGFEEILAGQEILVSNWDGENWTDPVSITDNNLGDGLADIDISFDGQGLIAWTANTDQSLETRSDWEIKYSVRTENEWGEPQNLTNDEAADCSVDLDFHSDGTAIAVWLSDEDADFISDDDTNIKYAFWNGEAWSEVAAIPTGNGPMSDPSVTWLSNGDACVAWVTALIIDDTTRYRLSMSRYNRDNDNWSDLETVYQNIQKIDEPKIQAAMVGENNIVQLVWRGFGESAAEDFFTTFKNIDAGGNWVDITPLTEDDFTDWMAAVAIDDNRNTYMINAKADMQPLDEEFRARNRLPRNVDGSDIGNLANKHKLFRGLNFRANGISRDLGLEDELNFGINRIEPDLRTDNEHITFSQGEEENIIYADAGEVVQISVAILNDGAVTSEETPVTFWLGNPTEEGSQQIGEAVVDALEPDATTALTVEWQAIPGQHEIYVHIDHEETTTDRNRRNNLRHATLHVIPNLNIETISVSNDNPLVEEEITLTASITNNGGADAGALTVSFWNCNPENEESEEIGTVDVEGINKGTVSQVGINYTVVEGIQELWAVVNPGFNLAEEDSTDNRSSFLLKVLPDLYVTADEITADAPDNNEISRLCAIVHNNGGVQGENVIVRFYNGNPMLNGGLIAEAIIDALPAKDEVDVQVDWEDVEMGVQTVYVVVDPENEVPERNENNNRAYREFYLDFLPDLAIVSDAIVLKPMSPVIEQEFVVSGQFENSASGEASYVSFQVYLDYPDSTLLMGYERIYEQLEPHSETEFEFTLDTEEMAAGIHTLYFILDKSEIVEEYNEDNNQASVSFFVLGQPLRLRVSIEDNNIRLEWDVVEGATAYNIYRSEHPYFEASDENLLQQVAEPGYLDENAAGGEALYFYKVEACHEE